jgi:hypothetical protein
MAMNAFPQLFTPQLRAPFSALFRTIDVFLAALVLVAFS